LLKTRSDRTRAVIARSLKGDVAIRYNRRNALALDRRVASLLAMTDPVKTRRAQSRDRGLRRGPKAEKEKIALGVGASL
jgi:hypothetical protein